MVKTALFQYARKELYYELTKFSVIGIPVLFNCESIDESVKCEYYDEKFKFVANTTNNHIMKSIKNAKLNQKGIINILRFDIKYIIYILAKYNLDYILSLLLPYSAEIITNILIENYDIENLRKFSEIDTKYAPNYEKLHKQMLSYGML
jgi:ubiquitin C-terminal hydrolase